MKLRYLQHLPDWRGNDRWYVRLPGRPKIRLRCKPGTPEFIAEYLAALQGAAPAPAPKPQPEKIISGSFRALCIGFYGSAKFKRYDPRTQSITRRVLDAICTQHGSKPADLLEARHVEAWRDEKADQPGSANELLKKVRALLGWGAAQHPPLVKINVAAFIPYLPSDNPDGWHTWTPAELQQYRDHHPLGTNARTAIELAAFVGIRRSDIARLGPQHERDGILHFTEFKGRGRKPKHHKTPILPELRAALDAMPSKGSGLAYLISDRGRAYSAASLGNMVRKWCDQAGLPECSVHGVRKAAAAIAAENGASAHELMAVFGWTTMKMAQLYTEQADRDRLAARAISKLRMGTNTDLNVPPETVMPLGGTNRARK